MLCDECGQREAVFHSIEKINGHSRERHLCSECQKKYSSSLMFNGFTDFPGFGNFFSGFNGFIDEPRIERRKERVCPSCGTTGEEFLKTGFVGCADCYKEFASLIMPVIRRVQGDTLHVGKIPSGIENSAGAEYERLKKELERAIELEEYEQATIIRDRMRQLKGESQ